jgi:hypothetical protein
MMVASWLWRARSTAEVAKQTALGFQEQGQPDGALPEVFAHGHPVVVALLAEVGEIGRRVGDEWLIG